MKKPKLYKKTTSSLLAFLIVFQTVAGIFLPVEISFSPPYVSVQETRAAEGDWYNSDWDYRVKVTILAAKVTADLTDYPIYVDLANLPAGFHTNVNQTDARDIRVTKSDSAVELPREVVTYDAATDTGELHIKYSGTLSSTVNTDIYIYYGNALATDYAAADTYGRNNVWNGNYKMVQHLDETTGTHSDSTSNANNGTANGGVTQDATGKIDGADSFDGTDDYVSVSDAASLDITDQITIEAWVDPSADGWNYKMPITFSSNTPEVNYQVKIELTTSDFTYANADATGDDLRFYETNGTKLDYWIEEWNATGTSTIWVEVATNNTDMIYMYYGNSGAGAESNGTNTFEFFDDFESDTIADYTERYYAAWSPFEYKAISGGELHLGWGGGMYGSAMLFHSTKTFSNAEYAMRTRFRATGYYSDVSEFRHQKEIGLTTDTTPTYVPLCSCDPDFSGWHSDGCIDMPDNHCQTTDASGTTTDEIIYSLDGSTYHPGFWVQDVNSVTKGSELWVDWALVRKYTSTEPTATLGNETATGISKPGSYGIGANTTTAFASMDTSVDNKTITGALPVGSWYHIAQTYDGANQKLYVNGALKTNQALTGAITTNANNLWIGDILASAGITDEVRISATARSADWIATGYNNQSSPSAFYGVGSEEYFNYLEVTGTGTMTAGGNQTITITAKTNLGNVYTAYTGDKSLTFSGASDAPDGTHPTCSDKIPADINFGATTTVTFASGVGTSTMKLYEAISVSIDVDDGAKDSSGSIDYDLDVAVSPAALNDFTTVPSSYSPTTDNNFTVVLTARDQYQNTKTDYAGAKSVAWTWASGGNDSPATNPALKPANGNQTFTSGVTGSIAGFKLVKTETATLTATADAKSGTSPTITAAPGALNDFTITTENAGTETAGTSFSVTSTAKDAEQNTKTDYTAGHSVAWTWTATNSPGGNSPTKPADASETFASGAMTKAGFTLVNAGETPTITITADAKSGTTGAITVNPATLNNFLVDAPPSANSGTGFSGTTITSRDVYNNTTKQVTGDTTIGVNTGSVLPSVTIANTQFTDDGIWTGNITITGITEQPTVTLTATNNVTLTGSDTISVLGIPNDPTDCSASRVSDTQFTVDWTDNSTVETDYKIQRKTDGVEWIEIATDTVGSPGNNNSYSDTTTSVDHKYEYRVLGHNSIGNSANYSIDAVEHYTTPDAPTSVVGAYVNDTQFSVSYTDNAAVEDTHRIEKCSNADCDIPTYADLGTIESPSLPKIDNTGIAANSRYRWRASAETPDSLVSGYGTSVYSYTTPVAPTIGTPAYVSDSNITVNWTDGSAYEDGFRVWVSVDGGSYAEVTSGNTVGAGIQTYSYTGSSADHYYKFKVRAHAPNNLTADSGESAIIYTTPAVPTISAPAYISDTQITVNWTDGSTYEDGFKIERSVDGGAYSQIDTAVANAVSYSDSTTLANHKYQYKVRAYKGSLNSAYSTESVEIYTTPAAPTIGAPTVDSATAITWVWTDNSNYEDSFRLDFTTGGGTDVNGITAGSATHQTSGLSPNTQYAVHLHSYRADCEESAASADSSAVYTLANPPASLSLTADSSSQITASWNANSNPANTEYYIENTTAGTNSDWTTSTSWVSSNLTCGTSYSFKVKARNGDNTETNFTSSASAKTNGCGGGMPPAAYNPPAQPEPTPENPESNFSVLINNGNAYTNNSAVTLKLNAGSDATKMAISNYSDFRNASQIFYQKEYQWELSKNPPDPLFQRGNSQKGNTCTVYAKFYTQYGVASEVVSDSIILKTSQEEISSTEPEIPEEEISAPAAEETPEITVRQKPTSEKIEEIIEEVPEIMEPFIPKIFKSEKLEPKPEEEKPEEIITVPEETPVAMEGKWNLLPREPIKKFVLDPLPRGIKSLAEKFPELKETLRKTGINKITDFDKLRGVKLALPGLAEVTGLPETELALLKETKIINLPASAKENIPAEVVFIKTGGELIDVGVGLTVTDKGLAQQKFSAVANSYLTLIVKPESKVKSVRGYLVFESGIKNNKLGNWEIPPAPFDKGGAKQFPLWKRGLGGFLNWDIGNYVKRAFAGTLGENKILDSNNTEEKLVLQKFEYTDPDGDGIYTAKIKAPAVEGEYEIITVIEYEDPDLGTRAVKLTTVIDPEGYVYEKIKNQELRIKNAVVSLFWLNPQTSQYERWLSEKYQQKNPQTTDATGKYSFLVPEGTYCLKAETPGYLAYQSEPFEVKEDKSVHINIELKTKYGWLKGIDWKVVALILIAILLAYNFYRDRKRKLRN